MKPSVSPHPVPAGDLMPGGARSGPTSASEPKTILIVDDATENIALFTRYLEKEGYKVKAALDGHEALRLIIEEPPDLVLLDVIMPGIDGISLCRQLKSQVETAFIPVVLATTLDGKDDRVRGLEAGADEFLSKPVYREELMARVRSLLRWQEARDALEAARVQSLRDTFNRYVSPNLVDSILENPANAEETLKDRNTRVEASILFADLRGYTYMSDVLAPEHVVALLNDYFTLLTNVAHRFDGTIFNMAGDSLLVGYNIPLPQENPSLRAVESAISMQKEFAQRAITWREVYGANVGLGIGINSGELIVGNVGSPNYMNYTVIGDTVNVASRLQDLAQPGEILVTESLREALGPQTTKFGTQALDAVTLKGKSEPQHIYRIER